MSNSYAVPAVERTAQILSYLTQSGSGRSLKDIYTQLGIPKTTAFSIINTLIACGLVKKNAEGAFLPTLRLYTMGINARDIINTEHEWLPHLKRLRDETGFTVFYSLYDNGEQVVLEKLDGVGTLMFRAYVGERRVITTSASGKAMAAYLTDEELKKVLTRGFTRATPNSICDEATFLKQLAKIRADSYSLDDGEGELGVRCLGAPVLMHGGRLYGAVSVSTINVNLSDDAIPGYVPLLKETAALISRDLGYEGEMP